MNIVVFNWKQFKFFVFTQKFNTILREIFIIFAVVEYPTTAKMGFIQHYNLLVWFVKFNKIITENWWFSRFMLKKSS